VKDGIDFISLDNSVNNSYDEAQLNWFLSIVARDETDGNIQTIVAGMHEALPDSLSVIACAVRHRALHPAAPRTMRWFTLASRA